jgi:hypothetical protein
VVRPPLNIDYIVGIPVYPYWGWYPYPWYGASFGFGYYYGYGYAPWFYGGACWGWGFGCYYGGAPYYAPYASSYETEPEMDLAPVASNPARRLGSLRIRANEVRAHVFVDGVRVGIVDDFNGLSDHLELEEGRHKIVLQADGFRPVAKEVKITAGKTQTVRLTMKR